MPASFETAFTKVTFDLFKRELQPVAGVRDVLNRLPYEACVASSGTHEKLELTLGVTNLYEFFKGKIFSASDVRRGKPYPDLFLHAASSMGYNASQCVVIEDATPGIMAALAAGMRVLGYAERSAIEKLSQAGAKTFTNMDELLHLLSEFAMTSHVSIN